MQKGLKFLGMIAPVVLFSTQATAHPNGHAELTVSQVINHMLASPFHTGVIATVVIVVAMIILKIAKLKAVRANKSE